jgi:hypothetical protein
VAEHEGTGTMTGGPRLAERPAETRVTMTGRTTEAQMTQNQLTQNQLTRDQLTQRTRPAQRTEPKAIAFAAVSFVSGLVGLLVANLVLGPLAIILGLWSLRVEPGRRARATLGIVLGVADIAVFILLAVHAGAHDGSFSWSFLSR